MPGQAPETPRSPAPGEPWRGSSATVLIVDDEPDILESLRDILRSAVQDVEVLTALSGPAGLAVLGRQPVDLIVADYKMPGMDGLEFLQGAREAFPGVTAIMITAFPDLDVAIRAVNDAHVEYFLTKPFAPGAVIQVVRDVLAERRARGLRSASFERALQVLGRRTGERARGAPAGAARQA